MRQKILTVLLGVYLLFVLLPVTSQASSTEVGGVYYGDVTWKLSGGVLTISGEGQCGGLVGGEPWYSYCSEITSIIIEPGITVIGSDAFKNCVNLTDVTIPETVHSIGPAAFSQCSGLENLEIPDSVSEIDGWAFEKCANLKSIRMPNGKVTIESHAFMNCVNLTSIRLSDSTIIKDGVFSGCTGLESANIPDSMTAIPRDLFFDCGSLTHVSIPDGVTSIGMQAFVGCSSLAELTIPETVTSIGEAAFSGCESLTSLIIPDGMTDIEPRLFDGCKSLIEIKLPESITKISGQAFFDCINLENIVIPKNVVSMGAYTFFNCKNLKSIVIPDGVEKIGAYMFCQCYSLSDITIPKSVTAIGESAFYWCSPSDIYYKGSKEQWEQIVIGEKNTFSTNTAFHYMPEEAIIPEKTLDTPILKAIAGTDSVNLTWNRIDGATGYEISRSGSQTGKYSKIQFVSGGSSISFTDTAVTEKTIYYYKVRAVMEADGKTIYSGDSAVASAKPLEKTYTVKAAASGGGKASGGAVKRADEQITLVATPNAGYYFTGWKENGKKVSSSQIYTFKVKRECTLTAGFAKLSVPSLTVVSANATSIKVSWKRITGATGYDVYRAVSKKGKYTKVAAISKTTTVTYTDKKLTTGKAYYYKVRAAAQGTAKTTHSDYSSIKNAKPVPQAPIGLKAAAGSRNVKLGWKKVSGATGYEVYRATSKKGKYKKIKVISKASIISYTDKKLTAKKNYYYKVRSYKTVSGKKVYSSFSIIKSVKTKK